MNKQPTIGVFIGNANSAHTMEMMQGISHAAARNNVNVFFYLGIHSSFYSHEYFGIDVIKSFDYQFNVVYDYALMDKMDCMIIPYGSIGIFLEDVTRDSFLQKFAPTPIICLEDNEPSESVSTIITDNYNGMYKMVEHLIKDHGYKKIAYLSGPHSNFEARQRLKAFEDAMAAYDLPVPPERMEEGDFSDCVGTQVRNLLDGTPGLEAIVCANDLMAYTAYEECKARGLIIGKDIAITGYDDWTAADTMDPPLTTVLQDSYMIGYEAVNCALELLNGGAPFSRISPARIQYRNSCGCYKMDVLPRRRITSDLESLQTFRQKIWFLPLVTKDMFAHIENERTFYHTVLDKLWSFEIRKCYLYLFPEPIVHRYKDTWTLPEKMYLAAHSDTPTGEIVSYEPADRPLLLSSDGLISQTITSQPFQRSIFCLFCEKYQYGILVAESKPDNISMAYLISTQIGLALRYFRSVQALRETKNKLQKLVEEVEEKNAILNALSDYDTLTRCLNRRGLLKKTAERVHNSIGQNGLVLMCDMDHLKEINDTYGHNEGDFAICQCGQALEEVLSPYGYVGRLGGDEFLSFLFPPESVTVDQLVASIKERFAEYNSTSTKGYYIEISVGYTSFSCAENLDYPSIIEQADQDLYRDKKQRRASSLRPSETDQ